MGAVSILREEWAYYQWGELTPAEAAAAWNDIINKTYADSFTETCAVVSAPFWDDESGDDSDDTASEEDQPWFGFWDGETFVESLAYITVTAFLATFLGEGAAIEYVTPLRQFRLKLKANPHGAKLLIFMDSNIFQLVDLFSATDEVREVVVLSPGSTLMLVHSGEHNPSATPDANGNYVCDVIKSQLSESDVIPSNQRYHEETDTVQFSPDGGATWVDMPSLDPRHSTAFLYPPLGSDVRCDAAANMVKWMKDFLDQATELLGDGATALAVANEAIRLYTLITGGTLTLLSVLVDVAGALFSLGSTALLAAFDSTTYGALLCCFYCNIGNDGQVSAAQLEDVEAQVTADLNTTAGIVVNALLFLQGEVGLSNAGAIGSETGDCDDCECERCYTWFFDASDGGWYVRSTGEGEYSGGTWNAIYNAPSAGKLVVIEHDIPAGVNITSLSPAFDYVQGSADGCPAGETRGAFLRYLNSSGDYIESDHSELPLPTGDYALDEIALIASNTPVKIQVNIWSAECDHADGSVAISAIKITGFWDDGDFPADNC